jgi:transposase
LSAAVRVVELERENAQLCAELATLKQQLEWFKRQLFGEKSEKRLDLDPAVQGNLLAALGVATPPQAGS